MSLSRSSIRNGLLSALSDQSFASLERHLAETDLPLKMVLVPAMERAEHVYFLESGLASVVSTTPDGERIEVGHIGSEGMSGLHVLLDVDVTSSVTFMQIEGTALRMPTELFQGLADEDASMRRLLLRYVHTCSIQVAHSALANGRYNMHERLARWLLMCLDRIEGDDIPLTHEFLSLMLGVRRSGVTNEIHVMEGLGVLKATRGNIRVLDRERLEEIAGGAYGTAEREYERLIGAFRRDR